MLAAFTLNLGQPILQGLTTIGKYDGEHFCLTAATSAGKVFIHTPHLRTEEGEHEIQFLNINQKVTALVAGSFGSEAFGGKDILLVGSATNLLAYNVEDNKDIFYREVADGVSSIAIGILGGAGDHKPLVIVGGNCSIQGFDVEGNDLYWTVTGDNVTTLALCDIDEDGQHELLVGSEDYEIRIFQGEEVVSETTESEAIVALAALQKTRYGYALANGTVGVYDRSTRLWKAKSKAKPTALAAFDFNGEGRLHLIVGWSNGLVEVRSQDDGSVIARDTFSSAVSSILVADYQSQGSDQVVISSLTGEVRGYSVAERDSAAQALAGSEAQDKALAQLRLYRDDLKREMATYQENIKALTNKGSSSEFNPQAEIMKTKLTAALRVEGKVMNLVLTPSTSEALIYGVHLLADGLFENEAYVKFPSKPVNRLSIPLPIASKPAALTSTDLSIQVLIGTQFSAGQLSVFEPICRIPKFAAFSHVPISSAQIGNRSPVSNVTFTVSERKERFVMWLRQAFLFGDSGLKEGDVVSGIDLLFESIYDPKFCIHIHYDENKSVDNTIFRCDSIEITGQLIQDLVSFLSIQQLESVADFPIELQEFQKVIESVESATSVRKKLSAEIADLSMAVKGLVVAAEDGRILRDMSRVKSSYSSLRGINADLYREHLKRRTNHEELLSSLKEVNQMIQRASKLRAGKAKSAIVTGSRAAIKSNNIHSLISIIKNGHKI